MDQEGKRKFSFAGVAVSFFILIVLPLAITGIVISKGVVRVGEEATQANLRILDEDQKRSIEGRARIVAEAVAQFLAEREKDIRIASILPRDAETYTTFLQNNTRGVIGTSEAGAVKIPVPLYADIAFLGKDGRERLRVSVDGVVPGNELRRRGQETEYGREEFFDRARVLAPGDYYLGPVLGRHVNRAEFEAGQRFSGIMRMAAPVFDSSGFAGVVVLSLNVVHLMEFTDHLVPTESGKTFVHVDAGEENYTFLVAHDGYLLSHPADYLLRGRDAAGRWVPDYSRENYEELIRTGDGAMNLRKMGFLDENLPRMRELASGGKSGFLTYTLQDTRMFAVYAPIPYYGAGLARPGGFGWVGMLVDIDRYHHLSQTKIGEIQGKVARWQKASITVVIVSLILLFLIALILSRGIYRQISQTTGEEHAVLDEDDEN